MFNRKTHWQNIYQEKSASDVSWYQSEPKLSLELILRTQIAKDEAIIDIGGGASVLVDYLCNNNFTNLSVLDISENALATAKRRVGDLATQIEWIEADITQFKPPHQFSLWHERAVFHFLTEASDRQLYVNVLKNSLRAGGHLIIAAFAIGGATKCSGLDIVQYDSEKLIAELGEDFKLIAEKSEIHITPANKEQKFSYFYFTKKSVP
ncbi:class I SAM-dependent methyltransferase [Pseudanabaena sp. ABRG5-3]|uniref:class I SAM-dependent methyltransferase n=1 Tax=Pseudanabaena sp. ABRG5-3 TaxID=685565 RepID=UPI000DC6E7F8|nr:class I SAM-dependent methyltransferase [Pseudanabaena sp. ABRG5-3]BBC24008.1 methyltransferase type 12 [Pseudanabaena sp. ABRG5-3]